MNLETFHNDSPFLLSSTTPYYSINSPNLESLSSEIKQNPLSSVKLRVPRSNSFSNSLDVPGNLDVSKKAMPNRNSMLEYRYMQSSNPLTAYTLNNFLDNLPSSKFDAMYSDQLNSNMMSMSVPDSRYFDLLTTLPSNKQHETENYIYNEMSKERNFQTKTITYPTSYVGTSRSSKTLNCVVPTGAQKYSRVDRCVSKVNQELNLLDPSRGYDSEPNWSDRPARFVNNTSTKLWNYRDDTTRKWVERGRNNSHRTSLSLDLVKQNSWNEFDDDVHSKSFNSKRRKHLEKRRVDVEHSKINRTEKVTNKNDDEHKSSKQLIECKTYVDKTKTEAMTETKKEEKLSPNVNEEIPKDTEVNLKKTSPRSSASGSDDVFESPNRKRNPRFTKRRSSSLDALASNPPFTSNQLAHQNRSSVNKKDANQNRSSVNIKDKPEYCEFDPKSSLLSDSCNPSGSIANSASNFHNPLGVTPLPTTTKRALSIKKSSNENTKHSSDYDVRDRGRGRNSNGGRDSYRERHRERDPDRGLSDREQRESYNRSSFNRSMSNAEGTPEDKIGEMRFFHIVTFTNATNNSFFDAKKTEA